MSSYAHSVYANSVASSVFGRQSALELDLQDVVLFEHVFCVQPSVTTRISLPESSIIPEKIRFRCTNSIMSFITIYNCASVILGNSRLL